MTFTEQTRSRTRCLQVVVVAALMTCGLAVAPRAGGEVASGDCGDGTAVGSYPVVMVHGFNAKPGDKQWFATVEPTINREGATAHFFDYGSDSLIWVTRPQIGPRLAAFMNCLADASRRNGGSGQVGVVAHSMGGLATRAAIDDGKGVDKAKVAFVVTVASPHEGAAFNVLEHGFLSDGVAGACRISSNSFLCDLAGASASEAARAMAQGSAELGSLPWFPNGIPVRAVGSTIKACSVVLFYRGPCLDVNDPLVPLSSAEASGKQGVDVRQLDPCNVPEVVIALDVRSSLVHIPCSHGALMFTQTTTDAVRDAISTWKQQQAPPTPGGTAPRDCGTVHNSIVDRDVHVAVLAGSTSCEEARRVVDTYYNHPPQPAQGSGGFNQVGAWACISTSGDELARTGHAGDCRAQDAIISIDAGATAGSTNGIARRVTGNDVRQHRAPATNASESGPALAAGTTIYVVCQQLGELVNLPNGTPGTEDATQVWDRMSNGGFVSDAFVSTRKDVDNQHGHIGLPSWDSEIPLCGSGPQPPPITSPPATSPSSTTSSTYRWQAGRGAPAG